MDVVVLTEKTAEVAPAATDKAEVVEPIWTAGYWTSITSRDAPPTNPATAEDYPKLGGLSGAAAAVDNCASHLERRARIVCPPSLQSVARASFAPLSSCKIAL